MACLWRLNLDESMAQQYILNVFLKRSLKYFFHLEKIEKQNAFPWKFQKSFKGLPFHSQKCVDQKYL